MAAAPTIGLFGLNTYACADPDAAAGVAELAERLGYDSLWVAEHMVLPSPRVDPSPIDPEVPVLDPLVALGYLAARTERVLLGTGVLILPQHNPVALAKQAATIDVLSGGRLVLGVGVGYLEPELRAVGVPMAERGRRADEYLAAMRSLWNDEAPAFHGRHVDFAAVDAHPRPLQRPLPVVVGGHSAAAHRRAARHGHGWYGWVLGLRAAAEQYEALRRVEREVGREGPPLHVSVTPARPLDAEVVAAYAERGVERLIAVPPPGLALDALERFVEANAPERVGGRPA